MGKASRKKRKLRRLHKIKARQTAQIQNQTLTPDATNVEATPVLSATPTVTLQDSDASVPRSVEASEVKKIAILMTSLAAVVVCVAILNSQTGYIASFGQSLMKLLKIGN